MISFARSLTRTALLVAATTVPAAQAATHKDFVILPGTTWFIDTDEVSIGDSLGTAHALVDGMLVVDDFVLGDYSTVRVTGDAPLTIVALGNVRISGRLDVSGLDAKDVLRVFAATFPETGAPGGPGGGRGGDASVQTNSSTPAGLDGAGPFTGPLVGGGGGGETGYGGTQNGNPKFRRGAGGAGGVFASDATATTPATLPGTGLVVQSGGDGSPDALGALLGSVPIGGAPSSSPFQDGNPDNDFWGMALDPSGSTIVGELRGLWAGAGGGAAGDSVRSAVFPHPSFQGNTDDKGAPGGGGGGGLHLRARGRIVLFNPATGVQGYVLANGGDGGEGQRVFFNNNFFTPSGAGGGGGSGGHVVVESLTGIHLGSTQEAIQARGGSGGPATDTTGVGAGGEGGPGIVQLHAPGGLAGIASGVPLDEAVVPAAKILIPGSAL